MPLRLSPRIAAIVAVAVAAAVLLLVLRGCGQEDSGPPVADVTVPAPAGTDAKPFNDPFAYVSSRREEFEQRAARGFAHVLYARSPDGAAATAARVEEFRPRIERAAERAKVDPDLVEALVFLESGGYPEVVAGGSRDLEGAVGLTQILAETGRNLLGMRVDVARAERLSRSIRRAIRRGDDVDKLRARRRRVDERFDPAKALQATARYLQIALERFERRADLAFASYHMGIGNLTDVLDRYGKGRDVPYVQLYFDSSPSRNERAWDKLASFGDESSGYWFKLLAAREIMRLHREDPQRLSETADAHIAKSSAEEVLHAADKTPSFADPRALQEAWDDGEIRALPNDPQRFGLRRDRRMGELSRQVGQEPALYRGLRPEALALVIYIGAQVEAISGDRALTITSTVRDVTYQQALVRRNIQATRNFSLHTTGWAFDVSRRYSSRRQALAFQFVLDRLQALDLLAWAREPSAIHITVGSDARAYLPLLDRIQDSP